MEFENQSEKTVVPKRVLAALLASVSAGVVPRVGAPYIAIGRQDELRALLNDLDTVADGGGSMRFIIGKYGSGKSFLLQLIRGYALDAGFLTADADLSPERRFSGGKGAGVATYRELLRNLASRTSAEGGALPQILARWLSALQSECAAAGYLPESAEFSRMVSGKIFALTAELEAQVGGFAFAAVLSAYYRADRDDDEETKRAALRWLRGEFPTRTEARAALGVNAVIDDDNWYDYLKLWAVFFRRIGYRGLVVIVDECVNLYKIPNRISRENNYEKILSMFNDTLQGKAEGLALLLGGTPRFLEDERRGLYSYEALRSRLSDDRFAASGYQNLLGPVIRLRRLSDNELLALVARIVRLHGQYYGWDVRMSEDEMVRFVTLCLSRAGADSMITPREILRDLCAMLNILYQNPDATYDTVVGSAVSLRHGDAENEDAPLPEDDSPTPDGSTPAPAPAQKPKDPAAVTLDDLEF